MVVTSSGSIPRNHLGHGEPSIRLLPHREGMGQFCLQPIEGFSLNPFLVTPDQGTMYSLTFSYEPSLPTLAATKSLKAASPRRTVIVAFRGMAQLRSVLSYSTLAKMRNKSSTFTLKQMTAVVSGLGKRCFHQVIPWRPATPQSQPRLARA